MRFQYLILMLLDRLKLSSEAESKSMERPLSCRFLGFLLALFIANTNLGLILGLRRLAFIFIAVV